MARQERIYDIVAMEDEPPADQYGTIVALDSRHTIMGKRAYLESAARLAEDAVDRKDSPYAYAFVRDRRDGMIVCERNRIDDEPAEDAGGEE